MSIFTDVNGNNLVVRVAGIDPALSNFGLAKGTYCISSGVFTPDAINLIHTEKRTGKQTRQNSDDLRRAQENTTAVHDWIKDCEVVFAEIPTGSQSARGAFSNGVCLGILSSIGATSDYSGRLIQVLPHEVKLAVTSSKHATKEEMIEWGVTTYPDLGWLTHRGKVTAKNEHLADALATIHAGIKTDEFKNLTQALSMFAVRRTEGKIKS